MKKKTFLAGLILAGTVSLSGTAFAGVSASSKVKTSDAAISIGDISITLPSDKEISTPPPPNRHMPPPPPPSPPSHRRVPPPPKDYDRRPKPSEHHPEWTRKPPQDYRPAPNMHMPPPKQKRDVPLPPPPPKQKRDVPPPPPPEHRRPRG